MADGDLLLIGAGKMGQAMLSGWLDQSGTGAIHVIEPHAADSLISLIDSNNRAHLHDTVGDYKGRPEVAVLAVKPQVMADVLVDVKSVLESALVVSIAAGRTLASFEAALGGRSAVIRAMPNTPAAIGKGITALVANAHVSEAQRQTGARLLSAVGEAVWLEDEGLMDAVTAVSGSGPAYVFHLIECMAAAGVELGLPADLADQLARATVVGSGALAGLSSDSATDLKKAVTSPGGTTAAALGVLEGGEAMRALFLKALTAARDRSRELSG